MNINIKNSVRFKTFLTVSMKMWICMLWYLCSCTLPYKLHNVTCEQIAAAYQTVQMFTPLQNAVTKQWIVNSWYIAMYLPSCSLVYYVAQSDTADIFYTFTNGAKCVINNRITIE